jgi:arylsulfatase A-like enzyme
VPGRPNILLLLLDSARAANTSTYGYERPTTPTLDALAAGGALFRQAVANGCWTLPSHATMFTGRHPSSHGLTRTGDALPRGVPTLAGLLADAGYDTGCFSNNAYISEATGLAAGFAHVDDVWRVTNPRGMARPKLSGRLRRLEQKGPAMRPVVAALRAARRVRTTVRGWRRRPGDHGAVLTNDHLRRWIGERPGDQPWFAFVNYMEAHERYSPPRPWDRRFLPPGTNRAQVAGLGSKGEILASTGRRRERSLAILTGLYDGAIGYLDARIGELLDELRAAGHLDDTVVVVTADHGDSLGEHGYLGHRLYLYEELVRVPLVISYPPAFPPGTAVDDQVELGDLFPTLLELGGAGVPEGTTPFRSLANGSRPPAYAVLENTAPKALDLVQMRALRTPARKFIWRSDGRHQLFDLERDPAEEHDLSPTEPDEVDAMLTALEDWERSFEGTSLEPEEAAYDEATLERLRGLGYIG